MSESSAKVTIKSVTAEQIYPIITPIRTRNDMFFTRGDRASTINIDTKDPTNAARIRSSDVSARANFRKKIITTATNSLAPDEIPSTKGPAIGLWKNV